MRFRLLAAVMICAHGTVAAPLVGPGVGSFDGLMTEATKLYGEKDYARSAAMFLAASRASPDSALAYLQYARASMKANDVLKACNAYKVYLKAAPESAEQKKAAAEADLCQRQLGKLKAKAQAWNTAQLNLRSRFFQSLDRKNLVESGGALESLRQLVNDGYLGTDLDDMAARLSGAAMSQADAVHERLLQYAEKSPKVIAQAAMLYDAAIETGTVDAALPAKRAFVAGCAAWADKKLAEADVQLAEAVKLAPLQSEYAYFRGALKVSAGEHAAALMLLKQSLPQDERTWSLAVVQSQKVSPVEAAQTLEAALFSTHSKKE